MSQQIDHFIDPQNPVQNGEQGSVVLPDIQDQRLYTHADTEYASISDQQDYLNPDHRVKQTFDTALDFVKGHVERPKCMRPRTFNQTGIVTQMTTEILGFNIKETTGAGTASIIVHQGTDKNQLPIAYFTLAANESARDYFTIPLESLGGIYIEIVSGSVAGIIYTEDVQR